MTLKQILSVIGAVLVLIVGAVLFSRGSGVPSTDQPANTEENDVGGSINTVRVDFGVGLRILGGVLEILSPSTLRVGSSTNPAIIKMVQGTCNLSTVGTASFSATSTLLAYCGATGVTAGDRCQVSLANSGVSGVRTLTNNGVFLTGSNVSTTTNVLGIELVNNTGAATTSYAQATTSVKYWCVK